jgi:hypothetical protein
LRARVGQLAAVAAQEVDRGVVRDAEQPRAQRRHVGRQAERVERLRERVLDDVLAFGAVRFLRRALDCGRLAAVTNVFSPDRESPSVVKNVSSDVKMIPSVTTEIPFPVFQSDPFAL